jgi:uncharacterized protein YndB with AHSA1/START domain
MNQFEITTEINRPVEDVFAAFEDVDKYSDWNDNLTQARKTSDGPLGVGSTAIFSGKLLGPGYDSPAVFTEYVRNEKLASKSTSGPFYVEITYTLQPVDGGTRVTTLVRGETKGFFKVAELVAVRATRKQFEAASDNLKALLEAK